MAETMTGKQRSQGNRANRWQWWLLLPLLLIGLVIGGTLLVRANQSGSDTMERVTIAGETFNLELAIDEPSRQLGLMHRESIPEDSGMLFVFPTAQPQSFWMGHCLVDIDIIYLDGQCRVTATYTMAAEPPQRNDESDLDYRMRMPSYPSRYPAMYVIELKAGSIERLGITFQDKIQLDTERLGQLVQ